MSKTVTERGEMEQYILTEAAADRFYDGFHATALLDKARSIDARLRELEEQRDQLVAALERLLPYVGVLERELQVEAEEGFEGDPNGGATAAAFFENANAARAALARARGEA